MMAAFAPVDEIVLNDSPLKRGSSLRTSKCTSQRGSCIERGRVQSRMRDRTHDRYSSSFEAASNSFNSIPSPSLFSSQWKYLTKATPSRL